MTTSYKKFKTAALRNKDVCAAYEALGVEHELVRTIIKQRINRGWTQNDLAKKVGTKQPVISRIEQGSGNPSLQTLQRIATALDLSLKVSMK